MKAQRASAALRAGRPALPKEANREGACKPSSVSRPPMAGRDGGHLSGRAVADALMRRNPGKRAGLP